MKVKILFLATSILAFLSCSKDVNYPDNEIDFKQKMREFVIGISQYSKAVKTKFFDSSSKRNRIG